MALPSPVALGPRRRRGALFAVAAAVLAAHAFLVPWLARQLPGLGSTTRDRIERIEVAFVRELQPAAPIPVVAASPPRRSPPRAAVPAQPVPPAKAASAAELGPAVRETPPQVDPPAESPPLALVTAEPASAALVELQALADAVPAPAEPAEVPEPAAPAAQPFEWPLSTRLSYHLEGDYRGPVQGWAQVEWLRLGSRYQVHLDLRIAGIVSRRLSSEGVLTDQGLQPERYEEVTQILLGAPRHRIVRFEAGRVFLANGGQVLALPQVQDTASQFVQLAWLFTTRSQRLKVGEQIEVPLALPGRMDRWAYTVQAEEDLALPVGLVRAFHLKPQRVQAQADELSVETWFAPSLQYLPVRILIRQDAQTFIDLSLSRLPQQAAAPAQPAR